MKINLDFISPCGLYCGVCAIYIAHRDNNRKLKERLVNLCKGGVPGKGLMTYRLRYFTAFSPAIRPELRANAAVAPEESLML